MSAPQLTQDMRTALREFAQKHGRLWKAALRDLWTRGRDEGALRRVRNAIGPSGLARIKAADLACCEDPDDVRGHHYLCPAHPR